LRRQQKTFLYVNKGDGRLYIPGLKGAMRGGKAIVVLPEGCKELVPGSLV